MTTTTPTTKGNRCERTDLLTDQCACTSCRPDLSHITYEHDRVTVDGLGVALDEPIDGDSIRRWWTVLAIPGSGVTLRRTCDRCGIRVAVGARMARTNNGDDLCEACVEPTP